MTKEFWIAQVESIKDKISKYEAGEIALTKTDVSLLYKENQFWLKKCEHWITKDKLTYYDQWEYCGHLEWNYLETFCIFCDQSLKKVELNR